MSYFILTLLLCAIGIGCKDRKVSVTEVTFDSPVEDIQWAGEERNVVFALTTTKKLYRSKDYGRTWNEISLQFKTDNADPTESQVHSIIVNSKFRSTVIILGRRKEHFISEDGGIHFNQMNFEGSIHTIKYHPTKANHFLFSHWTDQCKDPSLEGDCIHILILSRDGGKTMQTIVPYVVQFSWGEESNGTESWIFFSHFREEKGSQSRAGGWIADVDFSVIKDLNMNRQLFLKGGNKFLVSNGYIFVARVEDIRRQTVKLFVSTNRGNTFTQCKLPVEIQEKAYTIIDTSEGAIVLHVNHGFDSVNPTGHVYISDESGERFSLSLPNNVRTEGGECEFDKVQSLEGVYIANFRDGIEIFEEDTQETEVSKKRGAMKRHKSENVVKTVISYDKGGMWSYLNPPKIDSNGQSVSCANDPNEKDSCYLHLHGITNFKQYAPFYSSENAVGLILGTGNVGPHLRYEPGEVNTYLSRDGGVVWVEAHKGAYIYEFGDHGGLTVMADDLKNTNQVIFSWNEGQSWYDFDLSNDSFDVDNVVIEPKASSLEFLVYGTSGHVGKLFHLDFSTLEQPKCSGVSTADSVSSDYETWIPTDGRSSQDKCILGRQIVYTRRKQAAECYNGSDFQTFKQVKVCPCTVEDYECEVGFFREIGSSECKPSGNTLTKEGCTTSSYFWADAYRKIPGDKCTSGWTPPMVAVPCPPIAPFSKGGKFVLFVIVLMILILIAMTFLPNAPYLMNSLGFSNIESGSTRYAKLSGKNYFVNPNLGFIESDKEIDDNKRSNSGDMNPRFHRFENQFMGHMSEASDSKFSLDDEIRNTNILSTDKYNSRSKRRDTMTKSSESLERVVDVNEAAINDAIELI